MRWEKKLILLLSIISDLEIIHSQNLIHRDLHSGNILLNSLCDAYIADLGLTISADAQSDGIYGVLPYVAPEVLKGKPYTTVSDIYSFGIIMWEILCGKPISYNQSPMLLKYQICANNLRPTIIEKTPQSYKDLMKACWDNEPEKRPSAKDIIEAFTKWKDNKEIMAELTNFVKTINSKSPKNINSNSPCETNAEHEPFTGSKFIPFEGKLFSKLVNFQTNYEKIQII
ncbi:kinase-like domain-containing protein [Gigaspora rosea]|uniref:Kinase-like domain-containing protein n=1 Tax=Gigaspora rosea TaxID=44941 RepID=A0A397UBI6_9GLOM|nr:kinase-like domain-containing protein [Gigaspora rosea]